MKKGRMWMIRAGENGALLDEFFSKSIIAVTWNKLGDLLKVKDKEKINEIVSKKYPDFKKAKVSSTSLQAVNFRYDMDKGDIVITYDPKNKKYLAGIITGNYEYINLKKYRHFRKVKWIEDIKREKLSGVSKKYLRSAKSVIEITGKVEEEITKLINVAPLDKIFNKADVNLEYIMEYLEEVAHKTIRKKIVRMKQSQLKQLVANIINAMGYQRRNSYSDSNDAKKALASVDEPELGSSRLLVEIRHRMGRIDHNELQKFIDVLRPGFRGIYVSTGGFTKSAKDINEKSAFPISLVDSMSLVNLVFQYYSDLDPAVCKMIPLERIYWPLGS